jgi:hypothetical protein
MSQFHQLVLVSKILQKFITEPEQKERILFAEDERRFVSISTVVDICNKAVIFNPLAKLIVKAGNDFVQQTGDGSFTFLILVTSIFIEVFVVYSLIRTLLTHE